MKKMQLFVEEKCRKIFLLSLHLMIVFQPKGKKEDLSEKDEEMPKYIQKKIKSA